MKRPLKIAIGMAVPAVLLCLALLHLTCRDGEGSSAGTDATVPAEETVTVIAAPTTLPAGPTSVRISIEMVVHKKYNTLARLSGRRDTTVTDRPYDEGRSWWDNPMVIHQDAAFATSGGVAAEADSAEITGRGSSSNVAVDLKLVPHADITLDTLVASDCLKGTITATITTVSDYYDGKWTAVARATDSPVAFAFDTSDKSRPLRETTTETRTMPPFSFERYARDREKWEPRSAWPTKPKSGDWRSTIYVKDAKLVITGYQYADRPATARKNATQPAAKVP